MFEYWCLYDFFVLPIMNDGVVSVGGRTVVAGLDKDWGVKLDISYILGSIVENWAYLEGAEVMFRPLEGDVCEKQCILLQFRALLSFPRLEKGRSYT